MKWLFSLIIFFFVFTDFKASSQCNEFLVDSCIATCRNVTYLRDFSVILPKKKKKQQKPPVTTISVLLNKGTIYRFNICNDTLNTEELNVFLSDDFKSYGGNIKDGAVYPSFDFKCRKTQVYYLYATFNGFEGCSTIILSLVKKFNVYLDSR